MQAPSPPPGRIDLYSRRRGASKVLFACVLSLITVILAPLVMLLAGGLFYNLVSPRAGEIAAMVTLLLFVAMMAVKLLSVTRAAAWLEGGTLVVRSALTTRGCDLTRASDVTLRWAQGSVVIGGAAVPSGRAVPVLSVRGGTGRKRIRVRLAEPSSTTPLPPPVLTALANALQSGQRMSRDPAAVHHAVETLRAIAAAPNATR